MAQSNQSTMLATTTATITGAVQKCVIVSHFWPMIGFSIWPSFKSPHFMLMQLIILNFSVTEIKLYTQRFNFMMLFSGPTTCLFQSKICDLTGESCVTCTGKYCVLLWFLNVQCSWHILKQSLLTDRLSWRSRVYYKIQTSNSSLVY